ncbi:MAG: hypothetical protein GX558_10165 [Clostridiales bacterium]|nr:hypothetical protein [Clostridiales bacterium]
MTYISVRDAALKWNLSPRRVQEFCRAGRIAQAQRLGRAWMIPADAKKPADPRKARSRPPKPAGGIVAPNCPLKLLTVQYEPGGLDRVTDPDAQVRALMAAERALLVGNPAQAQAEAQPLLAMPRADIRMGAMRAYAMAALYMKTPQIFSEIARQIGDRCGDHSASPEARALCALMRSLCGAVLRLPGKVPAPAGYAPANRMVLLYCRAQAAYDAGRYGETEGMAEAALAMAGAPMPILEIYCRMMAAAACGGQGRWSAAEAHFARAWALAQPDGIIAPFVELGGHLCGLVERLVKISHPAEHRVLLRLSQPYRESWIRLYNQHTGSRITDRLTTAQFGVALLAARGLTNDQIAEVLGISPGNVRNTLTAVFDRLGISSRRAVRHYVI